MFATRSSQFRVVSRLTTSAMFAQFNRCVRLLHTRNFCGALFSTTRFRIRAEIINSFVLPRIESVIPRFVYAEIDERAKDEYGAGETRE